MSDSSLNCVGQTSIFSRDRTDSPVAAPTQHLQYATELIAERGRVRQGLMDEVSQFRGARHAKATDDFETVR